MGVRNLLNILMRDFSTAQPRIAVQPGASANEGDIMTVDLVCQDVPQGAFPVFVSVALVDGTAQLNRDYQALANDQDEVVFTSNGQVRTVDIQTLDNSAYSANDLSLAVIPTSYEENPNFPVSITLEQANATVLNTAPLPVVDIEATALIAETAGLVNIRVTRTGATLDALTFDFSNDGGGSAVAGADYAAIIGFEFSIEPNDTFVDIPISIFDNDEVDGTRTFDYYLSALSNCQGGNLMGTCSITDEDVAHTITITDVSPSFGESAAEATIEVNASGGNIPCSVRALITGGTAQEASDYTKRGGTGSEGVIAFGAGGGSITLAVDLINDDVIENSETIIWTLDQPDGCAIQSGNGTATVTINDDDEGATLTMQDLTVSESDGTFAMTCTVAGQNTSGQASFAVIAEDDPSAYQFDANQLGIRTWDSGTTVLTFTGTLNDNIAVDGDRTVTLRGTSPANGVFADDTGVMTIQNEDVAATLTMNDLTVSEAAGTFVMTCTIAGQSVAGSATFTDVGGTATGADYAFDSGQLGGRSWGSGDTQITFTGTVTNNEAADGDRSITVQGSAPVNATFADSTGLLTITDEDVLHYVDANDHTFAENGGVVQMLVTVDAPGNVAGTVDIALVGTGAEPLVLDTHYTVAAGQLGTRTVPANGDDITVEITLIDDGSPNADRTAELQLSNHSNCLAGDSVGAITVQNEDVAHVVGTPADVAVEEDDGTWSVFFPVDTVGNVDGTCDIAVDNGSASASDYAVDGGQTGTRNVTGAGVTVTGTLVDRAGTQGDRTFSVTASNFDNCTGPGDATAVVTISDASVSVLASETFTRSNGTDMQNQAPETGSGTWLTYTTNTTSGGASGLAKVQGGLLRKFAGNFFVSATMDAGETDATVTADIRTSDENSDVFQGLVMRATDGRDCYLLDVRAASGTGGSLLVFKRDATTNTSLGSTAADIDVSTTYEVVGTTSGNDITLTVGSDSVSVSSSFNNTETRHGVLLADGTGDNTAGTTHADNVVIT